jgi:uncharacterized protein YaiE (UPF0345 family)
MTNKFPAMTLLLAFILITGMTPRSAFADGGSGDAERPIRLYASARFGPIGSIADAPFAKQAVVINGRAVYGEQTIWGGEFIQSRAGQSVRVSFDSIGQVTLADDAMVRFGTAHGSPDGAGSNVLVASLMNGSLSVKLDSDAGARIEAAGSTFTASPNAHFRVNVKEGQPALARMAGTVMVEQAAAQQRYTLRPPAGQGSTLSVSARSTRQIQIQVTDENDRPVPDLPILFSLGDPCLGSIGLGAGAGTLFTSKTDNRGIASVPWVAGAARCAGTIVAKAEGTESSFTYRAQVASSSGFWTARNTTIVAAAAAAAGIGIGFGVANSGNDREPIRQVPPPRVEP